jgi:16S rRNA (guanine527-N7)-methyltransferase
VDRDREPLPTRVADTPDLPAAYHDALAAGLADLGLVPSEDARAAIDGHVRLLLAWTTAINLTGVRAPGTVALQHVVDSLSAVDLLRATAPATLLDLGSGGGFPGLPLAAMLPGTVVTLLEPIAKKARFLTTVVAATGLTDRVTVRTARAEALVGDVVSGGGWSVVTARAVASSAELIELAFPLLRPRGVLIAWKRGDLDEELAAAQRAIDALGGGTLGRAPVAARGLEGHELVVATRTGRVPGGYPRDPAARRRRPW